MSRRLHAKATLYHLYYGDSKASRTFRFSLLGTDLAIIGFFIATSFLDTSSWIFIADFVIALLLIADLGARLWISKKRLRFLWEPVTLADLVVIITLIAAVFVQSFAFLRVIRTLRLLHSYHVLKDLRARNPFFKRNEELIQSVINLVVFIFFVTALVYVFQVHSNAAVSNYVDALYFTVATLTTTGFGDITLEGPSGRLLSVIIMIVGVALFLRLVQTIFRPAKVHYTCPDCGLNRHDPDAVHCKHCGRTIKIETEGA